MTTAPAPHIRVDDASALERAFVRMAEDAAARAVAERGRFTLAIPGGSAAERLCAPLGAASISWKDAHIFWCDERAVSRDDPASNAGMLLRLWEGTRALADATLHPMPVIDAGGVAKYASELAIHCGAPPILDIVLLGCGEDGHVASLFPGSAASEDDVHTVLDVTDSPKPPSRRMTLTMPVLVNARTIVVAAFGAGKAVAIRDALEKTADTPVARVLSRATRSYLLLDPQAATLIPRLN